MSTINYSEKIPNNVNLAEDRTLQRALEGWQPNFIQWWDDVGPEGSTNHEVYLRTAVSVDPQGWAQFGHVKMRDYRWGIFLNPGDAERQIHFGDHKGEKAWADVPGEHRANLRRIIVTQGDTEPASVEQQRHLGLTAPSMYDLRNLFQINVEEGRHLWAMVYLLHKHFGRDGREEAEALLLRTGPDAPSNAIVRATLLGLDLPGHEHLLTGVAERYLDDVTALWAARPGDLAQTVAEGIFPSWAVDPGSVERFRAVVADDSHPAALRRIISEQTADMIRALAARAVDTAESG